MSGDEVLVTITNKVALVTLNRPKVLNAVNQAIVEHLLIHMTDWNMPDSNVDCIIVQGAGGKAFSAGGDVKDCVLKSRSGDTAGPLAFFRAEYTANRVIAESHVPYIALIDNIVMGGGVGLSVHGHFRVATERTVFAMPEVSIGLFPDIGASHFLHRLTGHLGRYLAITGARLSGPEVKESGLATHLLPSSSLPELIRRIQSLPPGRAADLAVLADVLDSMELEFPMPASSQSVDPMSDRGFFGSDLSWKLPLINQHFSVSSVAAVLDSLEAAIADTALAAADPRGHTFLKDTLNLLRKSSALSQRVAWEGLLRGRHATLASTLESEYQMTHKFVHNHGDFWEGVRAVLIDKDNKPMWKYASARDVPDAVVDAFFFPIPGVSLFSDTAPMPPVHQRHLHPVRSYSSIQAPSAAATAAAAR
uniref:3-hydroxyisobutyryl-CoA hydrolase n=1 Tax=Polytomella parva TaxID=51329 RepID=A0A7S0YNW8_9CHLO|eukprot:CAMPEP_0175050844 /NCGR_PEP_ID=MMETSP0052_2-20121109/7473_1 /TAXON_ID=51329 ORGANISM="Polytomella parva, Strain SAG 63-3" /NCGR_SAMPLE_ID=MMETSP0052_2 /ASSEMBLY_ACC=CAM_ASM_000194 /LENGTH=419 /DNA_ID=CAMNT_0016315069 /DNA_START=171 /DNA_END=1430 /DNA_ORIENTATION=+